MEKDIEKNIKALRALLEALVEFGVAYGFQILGALVFLFIGLKAAGWAGRKVVDITTGKNVDPSLARLIGSIVKLIVVAILVVITLGNFGISIAPLIALAGAAAFGATLAIQGPLSNFGAGFAILLGRTYSVGDTITIGKPAVWLKTLNCRPLCCVVKMVKKSPYPTKKSSVRLW
jgi:small conductance mechanosensitive channel